MWNRWRRHVSSEVILLRVHRIFDHSKFLSKTLSYHNNLLSERGDTNVGHRDKLHGDSGAAAAAVSAMSQYEQFVTKKFHPGILDYRKTNVKDLEPAATDIIMEVAFLSLFPWCSGTRVLSMSNRRRRIPARFSDLITKGSPMSRKVSTRRIPSSYNYNKSWVPAIITTTTTSVANNKNNMNAFFRWPMTTIRWYHQSSVNQQKEMNDCDADNNPKKEAAANTRFWSHWMQQLKSPPNLITTARILSTPVLAYWIILGQHEYALVGCVVAAASDYADGYLAKNYNMSTVMGGYLDPFADKLFINVLACSLCYVETLPAPLVALWLGRDVLLFFGAAAYVRSQSRDAAHAFDPLATPLKVNPTLLSKANTLFQFVTLGVGIVYPLCTVPPELLLTGLCYLTGFTTIASGVSYLDMSAFDDSGNRESGQDEAKKSTSTASASNKSKKDN